MSNRKPRIIKGRKVRGKQGEIVQKLPEPIPDVDDELNKNFIVQAGVAVKAPESVIVRLPIEREVQLVPEESTVMECYPCPFCSKLFLTQNGLEKHGMELHKDRMPEIMILIQRIRKIWEYFNQTPGARAKALEAKKEAEKPMEEAEEEPEDMCRRCGMTHDSDKAETSNSHRKLHDGNDRFRTKIQQKYGQMYSSELVCDQCDVIFMTKTMLNHHFLMSHQDSKPEVMKCDICWENYDTKELENHMEIEHNINSYLLRFGSTTLEQNEQYSHCNQCTECGAVYGNLRKVHDHIHHYHSIKPPFDGQLVHDHEIRLSCTITDDTTESVAICCSQRIQASQIRSHLKMFHHK
ncbi:unnamed protein product [Bursaphelenchus okinawaensis]|uniref:C2H2-type domain-containing protein n=1 Tax=Bursaphelenchus okinawaensis TaxID=465554 RepID=A0A811LFH3_9BILA|nr:unnamed protein product [Bursaphelenchus okinawaensis]CAG9121472.1 unnamed protein product [Bursaphelenchus okinawaensis]